MRVQVGNEKYENKEQRKHLTMVRMKYLLINGTMSSDDETMTEFRVRKQKPLFSVKCTLDSITLII